MFVFSCILISCQKIDFEILENQINCNEVKIEQWFLYESYHGIIIINDNQKNTEEGFLVNNTIQINSDVDLGIYSFWQKNVEFQPQKKLSLL